MDLSKILHPSNQKAYQDHLKKEGYSPATIQRSQASLNKFAKWANERGYVSTPMDLPSSFSPYVKTSGGTTVLASDKIPWYRAIPKKTLLAGGGGVLGLVAVVLIISRLFAQNLGLGGSAREGAQSPLTAAPTELSPWIIHFEGKVTTSNVAEAESDSAEAASDATSLSTPSESSEVTSALFKLYTDPIGGTPLWTSKEWDVTPLSDGTIKVPLGDITRGDPQIPAENFFQHERLYLGVAVNDEPEAPERFPVSTAAQAANALLLEGHPPRVQADENSIPVINNNGALTLAAQAPKIEALSGTFAIEGQAITLQTPFASDGDITLTPDGQGVVNVFLSNQEGGNFNVSNPNLTTGTLIEGTAATDATDFEFLEFAGGATPSAKFSVDALGNVFLAGGFLDESLQTPIPLTDINNVTLPGGATSIFGALNLAFSGVASDSGSSTATSSALFTDGGSYLYPTERDALRIYDDGSTKYVHIDHDGSNAVFDTSNGEFQFKDRVSLEGSLAANDIGSVNTLQFDISTTAPTGQEGLIYYDGSNLYFYDGTQYYGMKSLWTDGGTTTYLTSTTDDLAVGGTTSSAPFFIDVDSELASTLALDIDSTGQLSLLTTQGAANAIELIATNGGIDLSTGSDSHSIDILGGNTVTLKAVNGSITLSSGSPTVGSGLTISSSGLLVGGASETLANTGFSMNGNDVFIADSLGVEGSIYTDTSLIVGSTLTVSDSYIYDSSDLQLGADNDTTNLLTLSSDATDLTLATTDGAALAINPAGAISINSGGTLTIADPVDLDNTLDLDATGQVSLLTTQGAANAIELIASNGGIDLSTGSDSHSIDLLGGNTITLKAVNGAINLSSGSPSYGSGLTLATTGRLGVGDSSPDAFVDITGTSEQLRLSYETGDTNYVSLTLDSAGDVTINPTGGQLLLGDGDAFNVGGVSSLAYNAISDSGTAGNASSDDDLFIEDILEVDGQAYFDGPVNLGNATGDDITVTGFIASSLVPKTGSSYDLGSSARRWSTVYGDTGNFTTISGSIAGGGTTSSDWLINNDNATADTEDSTLTFERGTPAVNAQFKWDSTNKYITVNAPYFVNLDTGITPSGTAALIVNQTQAQDIFTASSSGTPRFVIDNSGNVGIGDTTPDGKLDVENSSLGFNFILGTSGGGITLSTAGTAGIDVDTAGQISLVSNQGAANSIELVASAGGIDISSGSGSGDIDILAGRDLYFDDDNLSTKVPLAVADTALNAALTQGIIDAINDVYSAVTGGGGGLWTDSGTTTYLTTTTDDLAVGGTDSTAPFFIDVSSKLDLNLALDLDSTGQLSLATTQGAANAIELVSTTGGIDLSTGSDSHSIDILGGNTITLKAVNGNITLSSGSPSTSSGLTINTSGNVIAGNNLTATGDLTVSGGDITLGTTSIFSGGDTASLNNIDAIDSTTETTFESALDIAGDVTGTGLGSVSLASNTVDDAELVDALTYTGSLTLSGTLTANSTVDINSAFDLDSGANQISLNSTQGAASAIELIAVNGGIDLSTGSDSHSIDLLGGNTITLKAVNSTITLSSGSPTVGSGVTVSSSGALVGGSAETLANAGFTMNGNDLFVADLLGVEGNIYTDGSLVVGSTLTVSDASIYDSADLQLGADGDTTNLLTLSSDATDLTLATADGAALAINPAGAISINSGGTFTISDAVDLNNTLDLDATGQVSLLTTQGAANAIELIASAGGIDISTGSDSHSIDLLGGNTITLKSVNGAISLSSGSPTDASGLTIATTGNVGIGTASPATTAILDLTSTTKGFLAPRMTTTQRDAISSPATGLFIYNSTTNQYNVYNGTSWGAVGGGGGGAWSDLTVPTANLSLAHAGYTTAFTFDSVTTADAFALSSSSLTTGTVLDLSSTSTAGGASGVSKILDITRSGTNSNASHTAYGLYSAVTNTGTTSTNIGGYFSASGATNNYGLIVENGDVGIGDTTPDGKLDIENSSLGFNFILGTSTGGITLSTAGTAGIDVDTSGQLSLVSNQGAANSIELVSTTGGIDISTGSNSHSIDILGGNTIVIKAVSGAISLSSGSPTYGSGVTLSTSGYLGIGDSSPDAFLDITGTTEQLRLSYETSDTNTAAFTVSSGGDLTLNVSGGQVLLGDADVLNIGGVTGLAYTAFADSGTAGTAASDNDVFIQDILEVDGTFDLDGVLDMDGSSIDVDNTSQLSFLTTQGAANAIELIAVNGGIDISTGSDSHSVDILGGNTIVLKAVNGAISLSAGSPTEGSGVTVATTGKVGIGDSGPDAFLDITGTTEQLRLSYDTSDTNTASFTVSSGGDLTLNVSGGQVLLGNADVLNIGGVSELAYTAFSDSGTAGTAAGDDDVYIEDILEVDGTIDLDGVFDMDGSSLDVNNTGQLSLLTTQGAANAIQLIAVNGGIDLSTGSDSHAIDILSGNDINITAADSLAISTTGTAGEDITITNTGGSVTIKGTESHAQAIFLDANDGTAGGVDIDTGTGGLDVDSTGQISLATTQAAASSIELISTTGGIDLSTGSDSHSIDILGGNAITLKAVNSTITLSSGSPTVGSGLTVSSSGVLVGGASETIADAGFTMNGNDVFVADSLGVEGNIYSDGDVYVGGGEIFLTPISSSTSTTEGTIYYDSDSVGSSATDHLFVRGSDSAWHRIAVDMTKYSTTNAAVANAGNIEVAHNQNTNDLAITGWFYDTVTGLWRTVADYTKTIKNALQNEWDDASNVGFRIDTTQTLEQNLNAYWSMDEASGSRVDGPGTNDLTDNNTVGNAAGKRSNAADFELDNSEFLELTDNASTSTGDIDFTFAAWVNMESESAGTTQETIVSKYDSSTVREYSLYYTGATTDRFQFEIFNSSGTSVCTATANTFGAVTTSTWYFILAYHDATANTCSISVNNGAADSAAETGVASDTAANFRMGANSTTEAAFFDGLIDETGFWKKVLTSTEKTNLYNAGNANPYGTFPGLTRSQTRLTDVELSPSFNTGTGKDGAVTISSDVNINTINSIANRSCADGGDAVNYSVEVLTATSADLESTPSTGCLAVGDEVLLINLRGTSSATVNVGNYETLTISSIVSDVVNFTTSKLKYYGDGAADDTNIGLATGNQAVMLQRIPHYTSVTISTASTDFTPSDWVAPTGSANNGAGEGGVMFFRATGTVSIAASTTINADSKGYIGGSATTPGPGGEAFCGAGGTGSGGSGAAGAGGNSSSGAGGNGSCGGGGGGGSPSGAGGTGSAALGGSGGGGGRGTSTGLAGHGGGGGYGSAGGAGSGAASGSAGGASSSGNGGTGTGTNSAAGGGGGGTYGDTSLNDLFYGSSGGGSGGNGSGNGGAGGDGGGIVFIAANTITVSGTLSANGGAGSAAAGNQGTGGGGAGGSVKLMGTTLTLGSSITTASGGSNGGGSGRIATFYTTSYSGTTSPTDTSTSQSYYPYGLYHSPAIATPNSVDLESLRWEANLNTYGKIEIQTRTGAIADPTDGTWQAWRPFTASTNYVDLETANTNGNWISTTLNVADGQLARNIDMFEDEDESASANKNVKLTTTGFQQDTAGTLTTSLTSYWPMNETSAVAGTQVTRSDVYSTNHLTDNRSATSYIQSGTGIISNAADLELSNGNFFEKTDNAELSTGDIDFTVAAWVKLESESAGTTQETIVSKYDSATAREYSLYYTGATADRLQFELFDNDGTPGTSVCTATANNFGAVTTATWYFVVAWHDATGNTCNIQVNNGTADSAAESGVPGDTAANLRIGANSTTEAAFFDGLIDEVGFWKKALSTTEKTDLYNSGSANTYPTNGQYADATISATDLSSYDYITFWVRASQTGNSVKFGFGESAATEQEETVTIDTASTWQKVYWDLSDINTGARNAVTKLRFTNLTSSANTIYIDNVRAEKLLTDYNNAIITSTPNEYLQYRIIFTTTNTAYQPMLENIYIVYNDGFKIEQADANTVRLYNYTGATQQLRLDAVVFGADLAEWYTVNNPSIEPGDVVSLTGGLDEFGVPVLRKANEVNDSNLVGIISTKAGQALGVEKENRRLLALAGRVPVKIDPDSPTIKAGDYLTSSSLPGFATKATFADRVVGKAFEDWEKGSGKETVLVLVVSANSRPIFLAAAENIKVFKNALTNIWEIVDETTEEVAKGTIVITDFIAANIKAGLIETSELTTDSLTAVTATIGDLTTQEKLVSPLIESETLATNTITPASGSSDLIIDLRKNTRSTSSGQADETDESTDQTNTGFGTLIVKGNASVSGELRAQSIESKQVETQTLEVTGEADVATLSARIAKLQQVEAEQLATKEITAEVYKGLTADQVEGLDEKLTQLLSEYSDNSESQISSENQTTGDSELLANRSSESSEFSETRWSFDQATPENDSTNVRIYEDTNIGMGEEVASFSGLLAQGPTGEITTPTTYSDLDPTAFINASGGFFSDYLGVMGQATITQLNVSNTAVIGSSLSIGQNSISLLGCADQLTQSEQIGTDNTDTGEESVESVDQSVGSVFCNNTLYLQPSGQGRLSLLADLMTLDAKGQVTINGDLNVTGRLAANTLSPLGQELTIDLSSENSENSENQISSENQSTGFKKLLVKGINQQVIASLDAQGNFVASGSGTFSKLFIASGEATESAGLLGTTITTNATTGEGALNPGTTEFKVVNTSITLKSLVYITPTSPTQNQVLYVKAKQSCNNTHSTSSGQADKTDTCEPYFVVGIDQPIAKPVTFNWWIIN